MAKFLPLVFAANLWSEIAFGDVIDETRLSPLAKTQALLAADTDTNARTAMAAILAGGTIPGTLFIAPPSGSTAFLGVTSTGSAPASIAFRSPSGQPASLVFGDGGANRWSVAKESTANFVITRYNSSGVSQGQEFFIDQSTGVVNIPKLPVLGGSTMTTLGRSVMSAADAAAARSAIGAPATPTASAGAGQVGFTNGGDSASAVLPAGGTWFWVCFSQGASGNLFFGITGAGVNAGGTTIVAGSAGVGLKYFYWRIA